MAEGSKLLERLSEEDAAGISEAVVRPGSPVGRAVLDHLGVGGGVILLDKEAVKIQALARGKMERKRHAERVARKKVALVSEAEQAAEEMAANEAFADLDKAAVKIQALARGKKERKRHAERVARQEVSASGSRSAASAVSAAPVVLGLALPVPLRHDEVEELRRRLLLDFQKEMALAERAAQDR